MQMNNSWDSIIFSVPKELSYNPLTGKKKVNTLATLCFGQIKETTKEI